TKPKTVAIHGLPARRFSRIALLADSDSVTLAQPTYTCLPGLPFTFNTVKWEVETDPYTGAQPWYWPIFVPLRGLMRSPQTACTPSGDGVITTNPDDRNLALDAVSERYPFAVQIGP